MKIAFIGLGNMGGPMALNLLKAGHALSAFDLSAEACSKSAPRGCRSPRRRPQTLPAPRWSSACCPPASTSKRCTWARAAC